MTPKQATDFRDILGLFLGEVVRVSLAIKRKDIDCEQEYARLVERTFDDVCELIQETHALFCGEAS